MVMPNNRHSRSSDPALIKGSRLRQRVAAEAARLIAESGMRDFEDAKRRAAESIGVDPSSGGLPGNAEIDSALRTHQRLFQSDSQPRELRRRREAALPAMEFFAQFTPRLVGAVLDGTADEHSAVCLHLFADDPRAVELFLDDRRIPIEAFDRTFRDQEREEFDVPAYRFERDGFEFDLSVFSEDDFRHAPLDRITKKPMKRADIKAVQRLLQDR